MLGGGVRPGHTCVGLLPDEDGADAEGRGDGAGRLASRDEQASYAALDEVSGEGAEQFLDPCGSFRHTQLGLHGGQFVGGRGSVDQYGQVGVLFVVPGQGLADDVAAGGGGEDVEVEGGQAGGVELGDLLQGAGRATAREDGRPPVARQGFRRRRTGGRVRVSEALGEPGGPGDDRQFERGGTQYGQVVVREGVGDDVADAGLLVGDYGVPDGRDPAADGGSVEQSHVMARLGGQQPHQRGVRHGVERVVAQR